MALLFPLAALLCSGCLAQHPISPGESMKSAGAAERRACVANLSVEGSYWAGHTVKSFGEHPNSSQSETLAYLLSKISSIGYLIDSPSLISPDHAHDAQAFIDDPANAEGIAFVRSILERNRAADQAATS